MARNHDHYAVVVGVSRYASLLPLRGPDSDADAFTSWLRGLGRVPKRNIYRVAQSQETGRPHLEEIRQAFQGLIDKTGGEPTRIGKRLYIFMAGHGVAGDADTVGVLPANFSRTNSLYVVGAEYSRLFQQLGAFDEIILLMDCCADELPTAPKAVGPAGDFESDARAAEIVRWDGFAAGFGQKAREIEYDGGVRGVFSLALIGALQGRAAADGVVTARQVSSAVRAMVDRLKPAGSRQKARFRFNDDQFDIEICRVDDKPASRVRLTTAHRAADLVVLHDGRRLDVEIEQCDGHLQVELEPGPIYTFEAHEPGGRVLASTSYRPLWEVEHVEL